MSSCADRKINAPGQLLDVIMILIRSYILYTFLIIPDMTHTSCNKASAL